MQYLQKVWPQLIVVASMKTSVHTEHCSSVSASSHKLSLMLWEEPELETCLVSKDAINASSSFADSSFSLFAFSVAFLDWVRSLLSFATLFSAFLTLFLSADSSSVSFLMIVVSTAAASAALTFWFFFFSPLSLWSFLAFLTEDDSILEDVCGEAAGGIILMAVSVDHAESYLDDSQDDTEGEYPRTDPANLICQMTSGYLSLCQCLILYR